MFKIWLDDMREKPQGYKWARSVNEAKMLIEEAEAENEEILLDLDHDLGVYESDGGDGIYLLDWLIERGTLYPVLLHTANPVGRMNMQRLLDRFW